YSLTCSRFFSARPKRARRTMRRPRKKEKNQTRLTTPPIDIGPACKREKVYRVRDHKTTRRIHHHGDALNSRYNGFRIWPPVRLPASDTWSGVIPVIRKRSSSAKFSPTKRQAPTSRSLRCVRRTIRTSRI